jgi:hypothetical protein
VHSIEIPTLTNRYFSLTAKFKGVKTYSFFDNFLSFSGWCGVRGSSEVTFLNRKVGEGGPARVYSKALVEENRGDNVEGRIEFRGVR